MRIDGLQYCNWSEEIFRQMREGGLDAVHVTIAYHENFREMVGEIEAWNERFRRWPNLIRHARTAEDVKAAKAAGKTAVIFGFQNPSPIEDDLGMVEICHTLGVRFMQLTYNNQSLLASGCYEERDTGVTRFGREVIKEMNRVGLVIDMSHSGERSTLEAMEQSSRPIVVSHANPKWWRKVPRNHTWSVLAGLSQSGGMLGFSLYPHHLNGGSDCSLSEFCVMVARTAERHGAHMLGIGSDLCQGQPDSVVEWMRVGRWTRNEGETAKFPRQPSWFRNNRDWGEIEGGLIDVGFSAEEVAGIMGLNWLRFFEKSFGPA